MALDIDDFKLRENLTVADLERFERELDELPGVSFQVVTLTLISSCLKAAIAANWIEAPETRHAGDIYTIGGVDVATMAADDAFWKSAGIAVHAKWRGFTLIPKN